MEGAQIIVVILSIILGILTIAGAALLISFILLTRNIRKATRSAHQATETIGRSVSSVRMLSSIIASAQGAYTKMKSRKNGGGT